MFGAHLGRGTIHLHQTLYSSLEIETKRPPPRNGQNSLPVNSKMADGAQIGNG